MRMSILLMGALLAFTPVVQAAPGSLTELLQQVRKQRDLEKKENAERIKRFVSARDRQQELLDKARAELAGEEKRGDTLKSRYQQNAKDLEEHEKLLRSNMGQLGELQGVVRQNASDLKGILGASIVSAQFPGRDKKTAALAGQQELPTIDELQNLWQMQLQEMVESGRIVRFPATVITAAGDERKQQVTRIGVFTAVSNGKYLRFLPDTGRLVEPRRQPSLRYQRIARNFEQARQGPAEMAVDPTRGAMLALLVQSPNLRERLRQGGVIGYIILALGGIGLLIALERFLSLGLLGRKVRRQMKTPEANPRNPLGRILRVYEDNPNVDAETLGLKLDDAILRELPRIQRGLGTLAVLAAIAPLLGLLGTVTGIIETFQSITLFGTGDPRVMSGGISQALVTTVEGLVVAIPIVLLHSFLSGRSSAIVQVLDEQSAAMVARLAEMRGAQGRG